MKDAILISVSLFNPHGNPDFRTCFKSHFCLNLVFQFFIQVIFLIPSKLFFKSFLEYEADQFFFYRLFYLADQFFWKSWFYHLIYYLFNRVY